MEYASDINMAEMGTPHRFPSRQTTLVSDCQQNTCHNTTSEPGVSTLVDPRPTSRVKVDDFLKHHCRSRLDYDTMKPGWGQLALMPERIDGTDVIRSFNTVGRRLIYYTGSRLAFLEKVLDEHEKEMNGIRGLTTYQTRLPGQDVGKSDYDLLVEDVKESYRSFGELTHLYKEINTLYPVSWFRYRQILRYILQTVHLSPPSHLFYNFPEEVLSFTKPPPRLMVWFADTSLGRKLVNALATRHHPTCGTASSEGFLRLDAVTLVHRGCITLPALALLIPAGILFLCHLTRAKAFALVVGCTLVFSMQANLEDRHRALYSVCAWSAILVTIMVQMAGVGPEE